MAHNEAVVAVNASEARVAIEAPKGKALPPGPGEFISDGKTWKPAMTAVTTLQRNPANLERWIDVPIADPKSPTQDIHDPAFIPLRQPNPAAVDTIKRSVQPGLEAEGLTVSKDVEPRNLHKEQMESLIELQRSTLLAQEERDKRQEKLMETLVAVLSRQGSK